MKKAKDLKDVDIYNCKKLNSSGVKTVKKQKLQKTKGVFMAAEYSQRNEQENMNGRKTAFLVPSTRQASEFLSRR